MTSRTRTIRAAVATCAWMLLASAIDAYAQPPSQPVADPADYAPGVPRVYLSARHAKMCKVRVGDAFPEIELPQLNGESATLTQYSGKRATVVLYWRDAGWASRAALRHLGRDIASHVDSQMVSIVGVAVSASREDLRSALREAGAQFPQLLDAEGAALAKVGGGRLPRVYVLDEQAEQDRSPVAWFDIEYSEATRRELRQTLDALTKNKPDEDAVNR